MVGARPVLGALGPGCPELDPIVARVGAEVRAFSLSVTGAGTKRTLVLSERVLMEPWKMPSSLRVKVPMVAMV